MEQGFFRLLTLATNGALKGLVRRSMTMEKASTQPANVLLCALCTTLVVSPMACRVLISCTTRYTVASSQVKSWKAALKAAEAGGNIAYAELRNTILDP